jgi:hypothetical protein
MGYPFGEERDVGKLGNRGAPLHAARRQNQAKRLISCVPILR